jgi:hypothetical protein
MLAILWLQVIHYVSPQGFITSLLQEVLAAQVTIDATVSTAAAVHSALGAQTVFVDDLTGYRFYVDSTGPCVYSKTTDGGGSWGTAVVIDSQIDCFGATVWYDRWTPGDSGTYIHILTADPGNDDIWYNRLDTIDDSRLLSATPISVVVNTSQAGTISAGTNAGSITKGTDGTLYMSMNDNTDSYVVECSSNCQLTTSWTETGTNPMDLQPDWSLVLPLTDGDIMLINRDISADDMRSKIWDESAGSWSGTWTTIDANALENATYDPAFSAVVNVLTNSIYLAYIDNATTGALGGNNDDIKTATYASGSWVARADVVTNTAIGLTQVTLGIDGNTSDVFVAYAGRTTPATAITGNVYYKSASSSLASWSAQQGPINTGADDIYGVDLNAFNYNRLYVSWYGITPDDIFGDTLIDLVPPTQVGVSGVQATEVRASTPNFYLGGTFSIVENTASRNVTSVTVTETGSINAATSLSNIKLFYDLDTSAPYDCVSESYNGSETQFGATDTNGFSGANGTSTFTGTVSISPTQAMCLYVVLDVLKIAPEGASIEIEITDPSLDVLVSGGVTAIPAASQAVSGSTAVKFETDFKIQRGVSTVTGDTLSLVAGVDYETPISSSSAFIRITNTSHTGAGRNTGGGSTNAYDNMVYIVNPADILTGVTFTRRVAAVGNTRVSWEIIEYRGMAGGENEIIVRDQTSLAYGSGSLTATAAAVPSVVNDSDVAVFITGQYLDTTLNLQRGISTADWNAGTNQAVFTRGGTGSVANVSYATVEFTGSNWNIQRIEHAYTAVGVTQTEPMTAVNSLSRTFIHTQKLFPSSTHANFGHEVWLSGVGQVSFRLSSDAVTPANHRSVAWVIENTQTTGRPMTVTRSNGAFDTTGSAPQTNNVSIGKTLNDLSIASLFVNNLSSTTGNTWPEPILGARLVSATQYELWRSDIAANIAYRTEVVEWPTVARRLEQNYFRLYVDNNAVLPIDPWPPGGVNLGDNEEMTAADDPLEPGETVRIRMAIAVKGGSVPLETEAFTLQYAKRVSTCSAIISWQALGGPSSTTASWRGVDNTPVSGTPLSTDPPGVGELLVTGSTVAGTYQESGTTPVNPHIAFPDDEIEYDWVVQHNNADDKSSYCFRMIEDDGTALNVYNYYPVVRTVGFEPLITNWRWYDDSQNVTPTTSMAGENVAPSSVDDLNDIKLRLVLEEVSGASGENLKFSVQYSTFADFSSEVYTVTSSSSCVEGSRWCYVDGGGVDNALIPSALLSNSDSCIASVGSGCGTHNEGVSTTTATLTQLPFTNTEYEFTLTSNGAGANTVYYFRLYNLTYDEVVVVGNSYSYPSLLTEPTQMDFSIIGVPANTLVAGITTTATSTPAAISFGKLQFNIDASVAQGVSISTNAIQGYRVLQFVSDQLTNTQGNQIPPVTAANAAPASWNTTCLSSASGCFGYHTTDGTLQGGSARFGALDSYAALDTIPREIMYSSIPANETITILYRIRVTPTQAPGDYENSVTYIAVPVH